MIRSLEIILFEIALNSLKHLSDTINSRVIY